MEAQKKSARRACAAILAAAALWGVIGIWNRRLMAAGLSPTSIVTVRNCGGMVLLGLGAGFFYALYSIFGRYALAHYGSMTVTMWTFLFAGPASLVLLRPSELAAAFPLTAPGSRRWDWWRCPRRRRICSTPGALPGWNPVGPPFWQAWNRWWHLLRERCSFTSLSAPRRWRALPACWQAYRF